MFHMSEDSNLFRTAQQLADAGFEREGTDWVHAGLRPQQGVLAVEGTHVGSLPISDGGPHSKRYVPLYEAKLFALYDHRASSYRDRGHKRGYRVLPETSVEEHQDPSIEVVPFYWVDAERVEGRVRQRNWSRDWLIGWRDITSATNERTVIATVFPKGGVGDTLLLKFPVVDDPRLCAGSFGNLCSLVFDYSARQNVGGTHLKYNVFKQLPIIPPAFYSEPRLSFVVPKVLELTYTSYAMAPFARDLGYDGPPFAWDEERRAHLRAELDAFYARAYGLSRDELRYIVDPADVMGGDYPSETFRVLKEKEIRIPRRIPHSPPRPRRLGPDGGERRIQRARIVELWG